ncbi:MAG: protein kinase [Planctomycetes bacterium]|nr:protein kinase [Planctomycetota bacterium]
MNTPNCPDRREFADYLVGSLAEDKAEQLEKHLDDCGTCEDTIAGMENLSDTVIEALRTSCPTEDDEFHADPVFREAVRKLRAMRPASDVVTGKEAKGRSDPFADVDAMDQLGNYRLVERIGQGGMGVVYRAVHTRLDKPVALKVLPVDQLRDPDIAARFEQEMKAIGKLNHANLVCAHDAGESPDGRFLYLAMELVEGIDVGKLVEQSGPLPIADACEIARQAAMGLAYVHRQGLVHRDMKPSNLMLAGVKSRDSSVQSTADEDDNRLLTLDLGLSTPRVKLLDLGLALLNDQRGGELTVAGQMMGTLDYMAPEQASDSHAVDHRADIYALGCTLYKLLAGKAPFADERYSTSVQKIMAHAQASISPLAETRPDMPKELAELIDRMLAKEADDRPATADEIAQTLAPLAAGSALGQSASEDGITLVPPPATSQPSVAASEPMPAAQVTSPPRRRLGPWAIATAVMLMVVGPLAAYQIIVTIKRKNGKQETHRLNEGDELTIKVGTRPSTVKPEAPARRGKVRKRGVPTAVQPKPLKIEPEPLDIVAGQPLTSTALVQQPAAIDGVLSWTIETIQHRAVITDAGFSPDGERVATIGVDGTVRIWDVKTGMLKRVLVGHSSGGNYASIEWSPGGHVIASSDGNHPAPLIQIWDTDSGRLLRNVHPDESKGVVCELAWSPDANTIAVGFGTGQGSNICFYDMPNGEWFESIHVDGNTHPFVLAWSPDGKTLASGGAQPVVDLWDFDSAQRIWRIDCESKSPVVNVKWSKDGRSLAIAQIYREVEIRDARTGERIQQDVSEEEARRMVTFADCAEGGKYAVTIDSQPGYNPSFLRFWNLESQEVIHELTSHTGGPGYSFFSPDGRTLATVASILQLWDLDSVGVKQTVAMSPTYVCWTPDGSKLLLADTSNHSKYMIDAETGREVKVAAFSRQLGDYCAGISSDGALFAAFNLDLVNLSTGEDIGRFEPPPGPDGSRADLRAGVWLTGTRRLVTGDQWGRLIVWDGETGKVVKTIETQLGAVYGQTLVALPDGQRVAFYTKGAAVTIWNTESGESEKPFAVSPQALIGTLACSSDGRTMVTYNSEKQMQFWDLPTGALSKTYEEVLSSQFSPDLTLVATRHGACSTRLWSSETGETRAILLSLNKGRGIAVSPEGHFCASTRADREIVYVVQTADAQRTLTPEEFAKEYGWTNEPDKVRLVDVGN